MGRFELNEDFWSPIIDSDFVHGERTWEFLGISGSRSVRSSEAGAPGILRLTTGTTNGNSATLFLGNLSAGDTLLSGVSYFSIRARSTSTSSQIIRMGFGDDLTDGNFGSNGLYFDQDTGVSGGVMRTVARNATLEDDDATTGVLLNTLFRTFEFVRSEATVWQAYQLEGSTRTFLGASTTRIPTAAVSFGIRIETLTNAARSLDIDLVRIRSTPLDRR